MTLLIFSSNFTSFSLSSTSRSKKIILLIFAKAKLGFNCNEIQSYLFFRFYLIFGFLPLFRLFIAADFLFISALISSFVFSSSIALFLSSSFSAKRGEWRIKDCFSSSLSFCSLVIGLLCYSDLLETRVVFTQDTFVSTELLLLLDSKSNSSSSYEAKN